MRARKIIMKNSFNNINVYAVNCGDNPGFDIYLESSGTRQYLMHHRHNYFVFQLLRNGISLGELKRAKAHKLYARYISTRNYNIPRKFINSLDYVVKVIDSYINEMESEVLYA